jgi:UDP-N-acetylmuramyl pentapeptide phosphotransferase/UDP-N-acetylglucosamine-1-phosphate transferase
MRKIDFILYLISLILGGAGGWIISKWGIRLSLVDHPNERSSHNIVTPKGGGIGILVAFVFCSLYTKISYWFWVPATGVSVLGLLTDRFEISPQLRLTIQFIAGIIIIIGVKQLSLSGIDEIALMVFLTFYIVGTGNYYNFMDGINGIAGITGIVGFGLIAFYASLFSLHPPLVTLAICISFACLGFLPFNMLKARVFMGDVGSILLGFVFAGMVVYFSKSFLDFICFTSFLFPFYADELTTMVIRLGDKEKLIQPHRRHIYQLLANEYQIPHWKVSVIYGFVQLFVGMNVLMLRSFGVFVVLFFITVCFAGFVFLNFRIRKRLEN